MKLEAVENFYVNLAEILHAYFDLRVSYRWVHFLNLNLQGLLEVSIEILMRPEGKERERQNFIFIAVSQKV